MRHVMIFLGVYPGQAHTGTHHAQGGLSGFIFVHLSAMLWFHSPLLCDDSLFRCDFGSDFLADLEGPGASPF